MGAYLIELIRKDTFADKFKLLYGHDEKSLKIQKERYIKAVEAFDNIFGMSNANNEEIRLLSVPGRSEVGGNHTDHNYGKVLACAVNLDILAVVLPNESGIVRIKSEDFPMDTVNLNELVPDLEEKYQSAALIRGVCARLVELGYDIGHGFDAYTTSSVLKGSGLSSSAAFEVMVANIISSLYNNGSIEPVVMAQAAQFAEREFFGKPCGLMDQTACAVGGFVAIDFANPEKPVVKKLEFDFEKTGYTLCIVDTAGNHSNLNEDYASIQFEMKSVAKFLGKEVLNDCDESMFYKQIPEIREAVGDRAVLRAIHFFGENARVSKQVEALRSGNFERFKELIIESGRSSNMYLQNIFSVTTPKNQELSLALAVAELILAGNGAWRVHGGGFSGTIQAFVPSLKRNEFVAKMNSIFGEDATYTLLVRPVGAYTIK
jgi:galactokinase